MVKEARQPLPKAPRENFSRGLYQVNLPAEFGAPIRGKVRDSWIIDGQDPKRLMITTDRQSAFDSIICTIPGKGQVLNLLSAFWFEKTQDIIPNHLIAVPHPNVLIARQARATLPVEVIARRYMARSSTTTSIYCNYMEGQRRRIYGIDFPDGLKPNQEFPMGTIITPTTKAEEGHDEELADEQALEIVDSKLGDGTWNKAKNAAQAIFERGRVESQNKGLMLVDTKYEFGIDQDGNLMLIDEVHTPDSSRFWLQDTYDEKFRRGEIPDTFDKEILRRWLVDNGYRGEGNIPRVSPTVIDAMARAYEVPYEMITGQKLPSQYPDSNQRVLISDQDAISGAAVSYMNELNLKS